MNTSKKSAGMPGAPSCSAGQQARSDTLPPRKGDGEQAHRPHGADAADSSRAVSERLAEMSSNLDTMLLQASKSDAGVLSAQWEGFRAYLALIGATADRAAQACGAVAHIGGLGEWTGSVTEVERHLEKLGSPPHAGEEGSKAGRAPAAHRPAAGASTYHPGVRLTPLGEPATADATPSELFGQAEEFRTAAYGAFASLLECPECFEPDAGVFWAALHVLNDAERHILAYDFEEGTRCIKTALDAFATLYDHLGDLGENRGGAFRAGMYAAQAAHQALTELWEHPDTDAVFATASPRTPQEAAQ